MPGSTRRRPARGRTRSCRRRAEPAPLSAASAPTSAIATPSSRPTSRCSRRRSPVSAYLSVTVAGLELKNPVLAGSGEATATLEDLRAAVDAGAGAVVAKSANESEAAKAQLRAAEYALLDERWQPLEWGPAPRTASLFCRSGLVDEPWERWVEILVEADRYASQRDAYVVPSLIAADPREAARLAREPEHVGLRRPE